MAIDKLLPRYLNKDDDARILKSIEMLDALNVRVSQDADGNAGAKSLRKLGKKYGFSVK
jgi:hypothetical protein